MEQRSSCVQGWRVARPQLAIDFDQRLLRRLDGIPLQCLADHRAHVVALGEEQIELNHSGLENLRELVCSQLRVGFEQNFSGGGVYHITGYPGAFQI